MNNLGINLGFNEKDLENFKLSSELINEKYFEEIFNSCLYKGKKRETNKYIEIEIKKVIYIFDVNSLCENKENILNILDNIRFDINKGITEYGMIIDKNLNVWTKNVNNVFKLIALGIALDELEYTCSKEIIEKLFQGTGFLRRKGKLKYYKFVAICVDKYGEKRMIFNSSSRKPHCEAALKLFAEKLEYTIMYSYEVEC